MRLTLRTLLAYLDDVLDPADKEELGKKIESSDFAGDLILRTRDTMRRLRLSAPQVIGSGMALDPNTVAEYLDNALPPDQVGDLERICLESDMHLAEVASCHHVLTMVLGAPAEVDAATKARMYSIPLEAREGRHLRIEPGHVATTVATVQPANPAGPSIVAAAPAEPVSTMTTRPAAEIPEYLRAGGWSVRRAIALGLAALVLIAATVLLATGLTDWFGGPEMAAVAPAANSSELAAGEAGDDAAMPAESQPAPIAEYTSSQPATAASDDASTAAAEMPEGPLASPPPVHTPGIDALGASETTSVDPYTVTTEEVTTNTRRATEPPQSDAIADTTTDAGAQSDPFVPPAGDEASNLPPSDLPPSEAIVGDRYARLPDDLTTRPEPGDLGDSTAGTTATSLPDAPMTSATTNSEGDVAAAEEGALDAAAGEDATEERVPDLGTYLGGKTVLLRWNESEGAWYRVPPRNAIVAGDQLLALPEFRPKLMLASGVHLDMSGGTRIKINKPSEEVPERASAADPTIEVLYGRIVLLNTTNGTNGVRLRFGPTNAEVELERNATLGVEVSRRFVPGTDPRKSTSPVVAYVYVADGGIVWRDETGETPVEQPSQWTITDGEMSVVNTDPELPEWIDHEPIVNRSEQIYGAPVVEETLTTDRPADNQLLELFLDDERKRKEVKSLAARSSIHVGLFVPFVEALRDSDQRPNWDKHIETLRSAMALDPAAAESIWDTLVDQRGEAAATDLFEMLRGYSADQVGRTDEQVKAGAIAELIDRLESDSLDYRVLAVHNLAQLTGKRLMPNPAANPTERAKNVRHWRMRLEADELVPRRNE